VLSLRFILITMGLKDLPNAEGPAHRRRDRNYTNILDPNSLFLLQTIIERVPPDGGRRGVIWKKVLCSKELRSVVSPVHLNSNRVKGFTHRRRDLQYRRHQHSKSQHPLPLSHAIQVIIGLLLRHSPAGTDIYYLQYHQLHPPR
jgi:hypothetical protein